MLCAKPKSSHLFKVSLILSKIKKTKMPHPKKKNKMSTRTMFCTHIALDDEKKTMNIKNYVPSLNFSSKNTSATTADKTAQITKLVT